MKKEDVFEIMIKGDYENFLSSTRTNLMERFGGKIVGYQRKNNAYRVLKFNENVIIHVGWGGRGSCNGFLINKLENLNVSSEEVNHLLKENEILYSTHEGDNDDEIDLKFKVHNLHLHFNKREGSINYSLSTLIIAENKSAYKILFNSLISIG